MRTFSFFPLNSKESSFTTRVPASRIASIFRSRQRFSAGRYQMLRKVIVATWVLSERNAPQPAREDDGLPTSAPNDQAQRTGPRRTDRPTERGPAARSA